MSIASLGDYATKRNNKALVPLVGSVQAVASTAGYNSAWVSAGGTIPSTAAICDKTTPGCWLPGLPSDSGTILLTEVEMASLNAVWYQLLLIDRLSHQGGLSGTVAGAQTTNLPTAALTRYTSGVGVLAALEIYTAIGSTATTATISYTNQAGTPGQVSEAVVMGGAGNGHVGQRDITIMPLAVGDTGVKSVESVALAASTVSAAGNFGVTLFKPLLCMHSNVDFWTDAQTGGQWWTWESLYNGSGHIPQIAQDACLYSITQGGLNTAAAVMGSFGLARV